MLHSRFAKDTLSKKPKSGLRPVLTLLFLILLIATPYLAYRNYDRILYKFKKDKYVSLVETLKYLETVSGEDFQKEFEEPLEFVNTLIQDNPGDSYLYYMRGKILWLKMDKTLRVDNKDLRDVLFLQHLEKPGFPKSLDRNTWGKAIVSVRKALRLGIPAEVEKDCEQILAWLYFLGGEQYWESAKRPDNSVLLQGTEIANIYKVAFTSPGPNWDSLQERLGKDSGDLWKSIYYLHTGNVPAAYRTLRSLLLCETPEVRNDAAYLLGKLMEKKKNWRLKYYYHNMIEFDSFLRNNDWFLEEHYYTLRFLGKTREAKNFLLDYEQTVNEIRSENS